MIREDRRVTQDGNRSISVSFVALDPVLQGVLIISARLSCLSSHFTSIFMCYLKSVNFFRSLSTEMIYLSISALEILYDNNNLRIIKIQHIITFL